MHLIAKVAIASTVFMLSACKTPEVSCTIKIPPQALDASGMTTGVTIAGSMSSADSTVTLDAASMTIDVSDSNVSYPSTGAMTLKIVNRNNGSVLRTGSFGWFLSGSDLRFSNPSSVNSWLQSSGATASGYRVDYSLDNLTVTNNEEISYVAATVEMYSAPIASASATYNSGGGGGGGCREVACQVE